MGVAKELDNSGSKPSLATSAEKPSLATSAEKPSLATMPPEILIKIFKDLMPSNSPKPNEAAQTQITSGHPR